MRTVYLDGQFIQVNDKLLEHFIPRRFGSKGVYETMMGIDGQVLDAGMHLRRLRRGLKTLRLKVPRFDPRILKEVLRRNRLPVAGVRLMVWKSGQQMHLIVTALPYKTSGKKIYSVCVIKTNNPANSRRAEVKALDAAVFAAAYAQARQNGFDEALLSNAKGHIAEASRANIFWVKDGVLYTPPLSSGCLNGITRRRVMAQAKALGKPVKEKNLTPQLLNQADAAFLTNSLIGIKPLRLPL